VFIHYFGHENRAILPPSSGCILEDVSHSLASKIAVRGDYVFGSLRKMLAVGDGGFIQAYHNPVYEASSKLDTWLRYEAVDWRDMREAENMIDREWAMADISSQSLAVILTSNLALVRLKRQKNDRFLSENLRAGRRLIAYGDLEGPLLHSRMFESKEGRDSLRAFLAGKGVFASIHWPAHERVKQSCANIEDALWIEDHVLCFPVSQDYGANDMEYIATCVDEWHRHS
jgi:dTDP-4-amino-4,6-dideoxygalactose transaminase